jgi:nitrate reductase beta subunit
LEKRNENSRAIRDGLQSRQVHRLPHLLGHLQKRLDQPQGVEYAWFNNVESKPGIGYPKDLGKPGEVAGRLDQGKRQAELKAGGKLKKIVQIFANPNLPQIDDYYEPFTYDHARLQNAPLSEAAPTARPISLITGQKMDKITWGPNWEDDLAGEFDKRSKDKNFSNMERRCTSSSRTLSISTCPHLQPLHQPGLRRLLPVRRAVQA